MVLVHCRICRQPIFVLDASATNNGGPVEVVVERLTKPCCLASWKFAREFGLVQLAQVQKVELHIVEKDKQ